LKKLFTLILLLGCSYLSSHAQFIVLRGGYSLSSIYSRTYPGTPDDKKSINGFQCGILDEFPISTTVKWLTLETGFIIQTKGSDITYIRSHVTHPSQIIDNLTNLYYLDIPLSVKMYSSVGKTSLYFEVGPYVGIGLSGKVYDTGNYPPTTKKISWGPSNIDDYKRFDGGISMGVGLKIELIQIGLSYDLGLANIFPLGGTDYYAHNRVFSVFMELMFPHKDKSIKQ